MLQRKQGDFPHLRRLSFKRVKASPQRHKGTKIQKGTVAWFLDNTSCLCDFVVGL